jgi:hypothetical protein
VGMIIPLVAKTHVNSSSRIGSLSHPPTEWLSV